MLTNLAIDLVKLPPLGEAGTLTLVEELGHVAQAGAVLSPGAERALARLRALLTDLKRMITARERAGSSADPRARAADRALDDAWAAFQSWLLGWIQLPEVAHARVPEAKALYRSLFPKGLQFTTLDFKDEWTQSQKRIDLIFEHTLDGLVDALGGRPFLTNLVAAHRAYGEALHITESGTGPEPDALVRRALQETRIAIRDYVVQVAAMIRREDINSIAEAARLLGPVMDRTIDDEVTWTSGPPVQLQDHDRGGGGPPGGPETCD